MENKIKFSDKKNSFKEGITLIDIILEYTLKLKLFTKIIFSFIILAIFIFIIQPKKYTSSSKVVADIFSENSNMNIGAGLNALKSFGLNLGTSSAGLSPDAYPEMVKSRDVLFKVINKKYYFSDLDTTLKFVDYINRKNFLYYFKKYTIKLPFTIKEFLFPKEKFTKQKLKTNKILALTKNEYKAISIIKNTMLSTNLDLETGIITISVEANYPNLAAQLNLAVLESFQERIQQINDEKKSYNLNFIAGRLKEAKNKLTKAEQNLIYFLERNNDPQTIPLKIELDRLKREISLKTNLYNELQIQYAQTEIELKKQEPVIKILERPSPPLEKSNYGIIKLTIIFLFIGLLIYSVIVIYDMIYSGLMQDINNKEKIKLIKSSFRDIFYSHKR